MAELLGYLGNRACTQLFFSLVLLVVYIFKQLLYPALCSVCVPALHVRYRLSGERELVLKLTYAEHERVVQMMEEFVEHCTLVVLVDGF